MLGQPTFSISGTVNLEGNPLSGVTITLGAITEATDLLGNYTVTGLTDGEYTIVPTKIDYTFSPITATVTVNSSNIVSIDFNAVANPLPGLRASNLIAPLYAELWAPVWDGAV